MNLALYFSQKRTGWTTSKISQALFEAVTHAYENVGSHKRVFAHLLEKNPGEGECSLELLESLRPYHAASVAAYREHKSEASAVLFLTSPSLSMFIFCVCCKLMKTHGFETLIAVSTSRAEQPAYCVFAHRKKKTAYVAIRFSTSTIKIILLS